MNRQKSAELSDSCFVLGEASVIAPMTRLDGIDVKRTNFLAISQNHDAVVCAQISVSTQLDVRDGPPDVNRQIAFCDCACGGNCFVKVHFVFPKCEREYLRQNLRDVKIRFRKQVAKRVKNIV